MPNRAAATRPAVERPARRARRRRGYALFALFAFPNLALIAIFAYWPIIANVYLSLTNWDFISPKPLFIGLTNYRDRKSTRLNSSHVAISYAVFCLKTHNRN